jgi:hypothetical protein
MPAHGVSGNAISVVDEFNIGCVLLTSAVVTGWLTLPRATNVPDDHGHSTVSSLGGSLAPPDCDTLIMLRYMELVPWLLQGDSH